MIAEHVVLTFRMWILLLTITEHELGECHSQLKDAHGQSLCETLENCRMLPMVALQANHSRGGFILESVKQPTWNAVLESLLEWWNTVSFGSCESSWCWRWPAATIGTAEAWCLSFGWRCASTASTFLRIREREKNVLLNMWRFPEMGVPNHPFYSRTFHEINHPAIGDPPFMEPHGPPW